MVKVTLAFSGGLKASVCQKLLQEEYELDVITVFASINQCSEDVKKIEEKAKNLGSTKHRSFDLTGEFVEEYIFKSIKANGLYEGLPLSTALAQYPIAAKLVEVAHKEKADAVAHGCTGEGNDQFRFDTTVSLKDPDLKIIAPIRELNLTRPREIGYAKEQCIPIPTDTDQPYSIDENLWGRLVKGGKLENPKNEPPEEIYEFTRSSLEAPEKSRIIEIKFEEGIPTALNGKKMNGISSINEVNQVAGEYGIGRGDVVLDQLSGQKSRVIYEAPAAEIFINAHKALEQFILSREEIKFKRAVESLWADRVYNGLWFDSLRKDLDEFIDKSQTRVTGSVKIKLEPGNARVLFCEVS